MIYISNNPNNLTTTMPVILNLNSVSTSTFEADTDKEEHKERLKEKEINAIKTEQKKKKDANKSKLNKKGITVRFNESEYDELLSNAKDGNYPSLNEYIRTRIFNNQVLYEDIPMKKELCEEFEKVRKEMLEIDKKIDNINLNILLFVNEESNGVKLTNDNIFQLKQKYENCLQELKEQRINLEKQINYLLFKKVRK